jgi:hypothetical protein
MLNFKDQSSIIKILGALLIIFVLLWIVRCIVMSFQKDYFLSTDYTVDCTTGLIKPTGSAPVIAANLQRKTQLTQGFSPRYDFINGNIVDTQMNNAKVGTIPSACSTYEFDDDGKWGPAYSRDNRGSTYNYRESESPLLDSEMTDAQKLDWQNSMGNTNTVRSTARGTSTSTSTRRLTGISPNTGSGSGSGTTSGSGSGSTSGSGSGSTSGSGSGTSGTNTAGSAAGSGTGTSLNYVANAGLKPALSTCKQYYKVGWY